MELDTGVNVQESAAPAESQSSSPDTSAKAGSAPQSEGSAAKETQQQPEPAFDKNAFAAQIRRSVQAEETQKYQRQREAERARYDNDAKARGFKDYDDWMRQDAVRRFNEELQTNQGGVTSAAVDALVQTFTRREAQHEQQHVVDAASERANRDLEIELKEFNANPDFAKYGFSKLEDFKAKMTPDEFEEFRELVSNENRPRSLSKAFSIVYGDRITKDRMEAAKQAALNSVGSKAHMKPADGGSDGLDGVVVPADVEEQYHEMFPNYSKKQIRDSYARYLQSIKTQEK